MKNFMLSDDDYECLSKGIAIGVGIGIATGAVFENITLFFALGGVIGILVALGYSIIKEKKSGAKEARNKLGN
ncbi:MAG: hypothetical protein ACRDA5_13740 [Clostridium sp.]